jgi:hypothetical protein
MITHIITTIKDDLVQTFDEVQGWFGVQQPLLQFNPHNKGWNVQQVLEHISLTNHYLLILIRKATKKAVERSAKEDYATLLQDYHIDWQRLKPIGQHRSFEWRRPDHMEPKGRASMKAVQQKLQAQVNECLQYLDQLQHGEGVLHQTMMTVNGLGKIDVYHYICFLVQHARRHLAQLEKIEHEYYLGF